MGPRPRVGIEPCLIGFEGGPIDETRMMVPDENGPLIHGQMPRPLFDDTLFIDVAFVPGLAVGVSASIHRIGEDLMECMVGRSDPADRPRHAGGHRLQWKRQTFGTEPEPDAARRAELGEPFEDGADGSGDGLIRMEQDFTILFSPDHAHGQAAAQFSASGLVANASVQAGANDVELGFTHRALESQQKSIVEQRRMINAIVVANESIGDAAEFQQAIPIRVVPREARNFQSEHDTDVSQGDFAGEASESGAPVSGGAGQSQIFIDDDDLPFGPTQLSGPIGQGVLAGSRFAVMLDLARGGLANVNTGGALGVGEFGFGGISHWFAPGADRESLGQEGAPGSR